MATRSADKGTFIADLQSLADSLVQAKLSALNLVNNYFKNGFNSGGAHVIVDADGAASNLTATQIASGITMLQQVANFFGNSAVTQADYEATLQALVTT